MGIRSDLDFNSDIPHSHKVGGSGGGRIEGSRGRGKLKVIAREDGVGVIGSGHTIQPINPSISIQ